MTNQLEHFQLNVMQHQGSCSVQIKLVRCGAEFLVHANKIKDETYIFDEEH